MEYDVYVVLKESLLFVLLCMLMLFKVFYLTVKSVISAVFPRRKKSVADDVILITGGGRGIGRHIALKFAEYKPKHIILWGRKEAPLQKTALDISTFGVSCSLFICDVCNRELVYKRAEEVKQSIGDVTILVNNAGIFNGGLVLDDSEENIEKTLSVNALAHIWTYKAFLPGMISQGKGHIVTMSSMLGKMPLKGASSYCGSKYGTAGMAEALDLELEEYPYIHLTSVYPYQVANDMFQGLKLRFPWLIKPLTEDDVARLTVKAVLTNRKTVLMPALMYLLLPFISLFSAKTMGPLYTFLGVSTALDRILTQDKKKGE